VRRPHSPSRAVGSVAARGLRVLSPSAAGILFPSGREQGCLVFEEGLYVSADRPYARAGEEGFANARPWSKAAASRTHSKGAISKIKVPATRSRENTKQGKDPIRPRRESAKKANDAKPADLITLLSGKSGMASRHYRQSARACTAPKGRFGRPVTVISANFGPAAAGPGNSEKCRPGACSGGPARRYRHELRMSDARMPSRIYRKVEYKETRKSGTLSFRPGPLIKAVPVPFVLSPGARPPPLSRPPPPFALSRQNAGFRPFASLPAFAAPQDVVGRVAMSAQQERRKSHCWRWRR
jgi:hypothetical protein